LAARATPGGPGTPRRAPVDPDRLRPLLRQLAAGVVALHRRGMLHRDLKPSNVLVTPAGRVVILDFGLVAERHARRSDAAQIVGTVEYMAPEQAAGLPTTPASDWYSVGVMLFEALTGTLPFTGSLLEMLSHRIERDAPAVRTRNPAAPSDLAALCMALLARDPGERPGDHEILALLDSDPASDSRTGTPRSDRTSLANRVPLLGRADELALLQRALADARSGHTSLVLLHAAPGLGRSALLAHFLATLESTSPTTVVLAARCGERESLPYKGVDGLIDALARELHGRDDAAVTRLLPPDLAILARLFPVLRRVPAIARAAARSGDDLLAPHELRQHAFTALRTLLTRLAADTTLVLALDDLHWGDHDSAALLRELLLPHDPPPLLLIATHRDDRDPGPCVRALLDLPAQAPPPLAQPPLAQPLAQPPPAPSTAPLHRDLRLAQPPPAQPPLAQPPP
ncbi:MAG: serine/threonine-protein kinase PknK, partial [Myxococcales bacterium]|nr:serine/threonine-protein kinase PknK [Myxococcales bacterium]